MLKCKKAIKAYRNELSARFVGVRPYIAKMAAKRTIEYNYCRSISIADLKSLSLEELKPALITPVPTIDSFVDIFQKLHKITTGVSWHILSEVCCRKACNGLCDQALQYSNWNRLFINMDGSPLMENLPYDKICIQIQGFVNDAFSVILHSGTYPGNINGIESLNTEDGNMLSVFADVQIFLARVGIVYDLGRKQFKYIDHEPINEERLLVMSKADKTILLDPIHHSFGMV